MSDLRDIATLCKEIDCLTTQVDTLLKQRDEARRAVSSKATGGNIYLALVAEVETLRKERDQARREVCAFVSGRYSKDVVTLDRAASLDEAKMRGWDCYKENTNE